MTLTWKNSLLKRRHLVSFCFELWLPVLLVFGFTGLSTLFDTYEVPSGWSTAKFDPQSVAIGQGSFDVNSKQVCDCCCVLRTSLKIAISTVLAVLFHSTALLEQCGARICAPGQAAELTWQPEAWPRSS